MKLKAILATDLNNGIGKNNQLCWKIKEEMNFFKETTIKNIVVMGKNTFLSLKKPLKDRVNIVVTKDENFEKNLKEKSTNDGEDVYKDVIVKNDLTFLDKLKKSNKDIDVFIIGGKSIYEQTFDLCDEIYLSVIKGEYDCDTFIEYDFEEKFYVDDIVNYDEFMLFHFKRKE